MYSNLIRNMFIMMMMMIITMVAWPEHDLSLSELKMDHKYL